MKLSRRIMLSMLSVVAISGGVCALFGAHLLWRHLRQESQSRVGQDLNAAREFYDHRLATMAVRKSAWMDVLYVTDGRGRVIHRAHRPAASGDSLAGDRLVGAVLKDGAALAGTVLIPLEVLGKEGPALSERARIRILPTPKAAPSDSAELDSGMMLCAAAAVRGPDGELLGVLRAGMLLSRNYDLVDQVQNTVFRNEQYRGKPLGNATVFQDDVRISTNVLRQDGTRAIGTRVSAEVRDCVLARGRPWLGRAWVVNDWYVSAYAPIYDLDNRAIGMLYVGALERKFRDVALGTLAMFVLVTMAGLLAAGLVAWRLAGGIARPVRDLAGASQAIARGDFTETVPVRSTDEISALARTFNAMARSLRERDELLKERTRLQLTRSEQLAAVGRLAAGLAHEINNPLTGVLTFAHMLLKDAPEGSQQKEDIQTIIEATTRCRDIVRGLLDFSRQNEPQKKLADLNAVLREALNLTRNQARLNRIAVVEELDPELPALVIDPHQIQDVTVNVLLNAIDAMPAAGTLTVRSRTVADADGRWAEFEISDTGCGIAPENLEHVFDPFFTTKAPGKGTGLGLAISYGIVTEHGGSISVVSELERGTSVTVRLSVAVKEFVDEDKATDPGRR